MGHILVDSNVLLDLISRDAEWGEWSSRAVERAAEAHTLVINPIIFSEVSVGFARIEEVDESFPRSLFRRDALPWAAGFLAGKCFTAYRRRGGIRRAPLPDFYIGAHAAVSGMTLLTRDAATYRSYFPRLALVTP